MNNSGMVIRCDKRYLNSLLFIQLAIVLTIAVLSAFSNVLIISIIAILFAIYFIAVWFIKTKLWKYKIDNKKIHTEKIFSDQMDLHIPLERISGFNTEEGILEALFNVRTIIISTSSSQSDQVTIKWPYVNTNIKVTEYLEECINKTKKNS